MIATINLKILILYISFFPLTLENLRRSHSLSSASSTQELVRRNSMDGENGLTYTEKLKLYDHVCIKNPFTKYRSAVKFVPPTKFDIRPFLGTNRISLKVWKATWSKCDFKCFVKNDYTLFKVKLAQQINLYRKFHNVPPLKYSSRLCYLAQHRANLMALQKMILHNSRESKYGEVVGLAYIPAASSLANRWYDERKNYNFKTGQTRFGSQLFAQLVWKSTTEMGIGVSEANDMIYVVVYFYPRGNTMGYYKENVNEIPGKFFKFFF
ncbi:CAP domain-containing protein [Strongyloides ratti]|uniref:CAP domain-containing protein n=1 Tax=Strongyloides ratti TaxID=34506 RepID=A0A090L8J4_STRRB|nr:CAP domain-containing protein [Strongyloides ratti]CEF66096.1 CAP domain-containing protein [Strongyloides ratti]